MKDDARAEAHFKTCLEKSPTEPLALRLVSQFYDERKRGDEATAIWETALKEAPENLAVRAALAGPLRSAGQCRPGPRRLIKEGVELLGNAQAWYQLSEFERRNDQPEKALEAIDQAIAASPNANDNLAFFKADLLVDLDRLDEAEALVNTLSEPSFRDLLRGRILLARGDAKGALATFDAGLKRWPNNAGGRYLAGLAAHQVGDFTRAESEFREALRVDRGRDRRSPTRSRACISTQGRYKEAAENARQFVTNRGGTRVDGYLLYIRAAIQLENYEGAQRTADALAGAGFPKEAAIVTRADRARTARRRDAALREVKKSDIDLGDPGGRTAAARDRRPADRRTVARATPRPRHGRDREASRRGAALRDPGRAAGAHRPRQRRLRPSYQKALEIDPNYGRAKAGLAGLAAKSGDVAARARALRRGGEGSSERHRPGLRGGAARALVGRRAPAPPATRGDRRAQPGPCGRAQRPRLDARAAAEPGSRPRPRARQGRAPHRRQPRDRRHAGAGSICSAARSRSRWNCSRSRSEQRPESQSIRYHLGLALSRQGERQRALETLRQAVEAGPFPEAEAAKSELARLEQQQ